MTTTISSGYAPILIATVVPHVALQLDLYIQDPSTKEYRLYCDADYPVTEEDLARLRAKGVSRLYISSSDRDRYQQYLRKIAFADDSQGESIDASVRAGALGPIVRDLMSEAFSQRDTNKTTEVAVHLGGQLAGLVCETNFAVGDLTRVISHDYATFTHSANVAIYCAILAKYLGYSAQEIQEITTGGLLHDLGKLKVDLRILNKPGKLDDFEFRAVKQHPTLGFSQLTDRTDLNFGQLMMVYQHHERLDGRGYPVGLPEQEIHPWAKICSVVDVFEAFTSHRPYRLPMPKSVAITVMRKDAGTAFDREILACWTQITRDCWHD